MLYPHASLWLLFYPAETASEDCLLAQLAPAQRQRAESMASKKRRIEFYLGRLLLDHALRRDTVLSGQPFCVLEQAGGPPEICVASASATTKSIKHSISHSGHWIGFAFCAGLKDTVLGLDIELVRQDFNKTKTAYFCSDEQSAAGSSIDSPAKKQRYFTRLWTQKEAFFKAHETPILNPQIKSADFTGNALMHSTSLGADYEMSIYCSTAVNIQTHFVHISALGRLNETDEPPAAISLSWGTENYFSE